MGRQVNFYMLQDDEISFLQFVLQDGNVEILKVRSPQPFEKVKDINLLIRDINLRQVLFWNKKIDFSQEYINRHRQKDYNEIFGRFDETDEIFYSISKSDAPVIEYDRSFLREDNKLVRGRIWAEMYRVKNDRFVKKSDDFKAWYEQLSRWIRRNLKHTEEIDCFFGNEALKWYKAGGVLFR